MGRLTDFCLSADGMMSGPGLGPRLNAARFFFAVSRCLIGGDQGRSCRVTLLGLRRLTLCGFAGFSALRCSHGIGSRWLVLQQMSGAIQFRLSVIWH